MKPPSITPTKVSGARRVRALLGLGAPLGLAFVAFMGCASAPQSDTANTAAGEPIRQGKPTGKPIPERPRPVVTGLTMTYQNRASTLQVQLDPYDENLHIEMSRSPIELKATDLDQQTESAPTRRSPSQRDTLFVEQAALVPPPAPPLPPSTSQALPLDTISEQPLWENVTDEVLTDIRRAQELFYEKNYVLAYRKVQEAQDKRRTAEGHALAGSILYMQNDREGARRQWLEALDLKPNMPEIDEMLRKLQGEP